MNDLVVVGHGGHGKVVIDMAQACNYRIIAILDNKYSENDPNTRENCFFGSVESAEQVVKRYPSAKWIIAIGDNNMRSKLAVHLTILGAQFATIIHPQAFIGGGAFVASGTVVMPNAVVGVDVKVGSHCIVNTGAIIEHDCSIENYAHIAPRATLAGGVKVDQGVLVGIGASVIPLMQINQWAVVGAGAVVVNNVNRNEIVVGVPAKHLRKTGDRRFT